jgi:RHS repeat-associated protein
VEDGGSLAIADASGLRRVDTNGIISTPTGSTGLGSARAVATGADGSLYVATQTSIVRILPDGSQQQVVGATANGLAVDGRGDVYYSDQYGINLVYPDGDVQLLVADSGVGAFSSFGSLALDQFGNLYYTSQDDLDGCVTELTRHDRLITLHHAIYGQFAGLAVDSAGAVYVSDGYNSLYLVEDDGSLSKLAGSDDALLSQPQGLAIDGAGDLLVADHGNNRVIKDDEVTAPAPARPLAGPPPAPMPPTVIGPTEEDGGSNGSEPCDCSQGQATQSPVDTATGNFWHTFTDLSIPGRGLPLDLSRSYNANLAAVDGPFGHGWSTSYTMSLTTDAHGNVTVHQENGSTVAFAPDGDGGYVPGAARVLATLAPGPNGSFVFTRRARHVFTFDAAGKLTSKSDLNGETTTVGYDGSGNLSTVTDPAGRHLHFTVVKGRIASARDDAGRQVDYSYNGSGDLTGVTDPTGATWTLGYDTNHQLTSMLDPNQHGAVDPRPLTNVYDGQGRVTSQTDYAGRTTTFDYTSTPGSTVITDPRGNVTIDTYKNGMLQSTTKAAGTDDEATWTHNYDPDLLAQTAVHGPDGTWSTTYDAAGNKIDATDPVGDEQTWTYDSLNDMTSHTDADGVTTTNTFDGHGNLLTSSTPIGPATRTTVFHHGNPAHPGDVTSVTDPDGKTATMSYDSYGQLTTTTDADGNTTTFSYTCPSGCYNNIGLIYATVSPRGNVTGATPADFQTTSRYDADGRMISTTNALGHTTLVGYDLNGSRTSVIDPNGNVTTLAYDRDGELTTTTRADTTTVSTSYDADGNVTAQTNAAGHATTYAYDHRDRVVSMTDPDNHVTTYSYDAAGNLLTTTDPAGRTTTRSYDPADRLTGIDYSDPATPDVAYTYDPAGRRLTMADGTGTTTYSHDALGRLTGVTDGTGDTVGYGYDLRGSLTSLTYPNGHTVSRTYTDAGRLATVSDWLGHIIRFDYNLDGALTAIHDPNGVDETTTYDRADEVVGMSDVKSSVTLAGYTYSRDSNGQLTATSPTGATGQTNESYDYTQLNQLHHYTTGLSSGAYGYNSADDPVTLADGTTQTFDPADELLTSTSGAATTTFGYNADGDRTTAASPAGTAHYGYDQADRLTSYTNPTGTTSANYLYNGDGLRQSKTVGGTATPETWDVSGGLPLLLRQDSTSVLYGPGGMPVEQITPQPTISRVGATSASNILSNKTSLSLPLPAGIQPGDEIILAITVPSAQSVTWPAGFTGIGSYTTGALGTRLVLFAGRATGSASSVTINYSGGTLTSMAAVAAVYRGVDAHTPLDASVASAVTGTVPSSTLTVTGPTTTVDADQLVGVFATTSPGPSTWTAPTGMTIRAHSDNQIRADIALADQVLSGHGAVGDKTATYGVPASAAGALLALRPADPIRYYAHDQQGSTRLLTDSLGNIVGSYAYDPYGRITAHAGEAAVLRYDGQLQDDESGLLYLRARYYDPQTAQFPTNDPLNALTRTTYGYANSSPLNSFDPSGLDSDAVAAARQSAADAGLIVTANGVTMPDLPEGYIGTNNLVDLAEFGQIDCASYEQHLGLIAVRKAQLAAFAAYNERMNQADMQAAQSGVFHAVGEVLRLAGEGIGIASSFGGGWIAAIGGAIGTTLSVAGTYIQTGSADAAWYDLQVEAVLSVAGMAGPEGRAAAYAALASALGDQMPAY